MSLDNDDPSTDGIQNYGRVIVYDVDATTCDVVVALDFEDGEPVGVVAIFGGLRKTALKVSVDMEDHDGITVSSQPALVLRARDDPTVEVVSRENDPAGLADQAGR